MALSVSTGGGHAVVSKNPVKSHQCNSKRCIPPPRAGPPWFAGGLLLADPLGALAAGISATRKHLWVLPGASHEALKASACLGWWDASRRSRAGLFGSAEHAWRALPWIGRSAWRCRDDHDPAALEKLCLVEERTGLSE